jgi:di/tricarboxylate transporter
MTGQIALMLFVVGASLILFSIERFPADLTALGVMLTLVLTGLLPKEAAFAGFGSDAVILILSLLILTAALVRTGVVDTVGKAILHRIGESPQRLLVVIMVTAATLSAFMSNTATTAFFTPIAISIARRLRVSVSKLLMPLAFAAILASSVTLISSSTNIVISDLMVQHNLAPLGMFELAPAGIPIAIAGLIYMFLVGKFLIPDYGTPEDPIEEFGLRPYLTEIVILPESPLIGKTLIESGLGHDLDLIVLRVVRDEQSYPALQSDLQFQKDDVLLVEGRRDRILEIKDKVGIAIRADVKFSDPTLEIEHMRLIEAIILRKSPLLGRTLEQVNFRERYGLQVLGINRHGQTILQRIRQIPLHIGDQLLVQGHQANVAALDASNVFRVIGTVEYKQPQRRRARWAIGIFAASLLVAATGIVSLAVAVLLGAFAAFLSGCITPDEAYREVEWKAIIVIGCMLAVGSAMEITGTAQFLASELIGFIGATHPIWLLTAFFTLTLLLTQPMSNQAAAVVVIPIALETAVQLGLNPRTFAIMIALGASCSYLTPLEPSCLIVYGPGEYRVTDFLKVGSLLTLLTYLIAITLVPLIWPL